MQTNSNLDELSDNLIRKIKSHLINHMAKTLDEASEDEFYRAISFAIREETMINWLATNRTMDKEDPRTIYYISMEYMPGRLFQNNITNLCSQDILKAVAQKCNRNLKKIASYEEDPGLGNGGLGRLASCFLDSLATKKYPAIAYGLRYQYGIFEQQIKDGVQIEAPDCWLLYENPWEFRRDYNRVHVHFCGTPQVNYNIHGDEVLDLVNGEEVAALPFDYPIVGYSKNSDFSVVTLRLWSTKDSPRNFLLQKYNAGRLDQAAENTTLTDVLYPSDNHEVGKRIRLKQEYLLVSASLQDIIHRYLQKNRSFKNFSEKVRIQINDTHPALVIAELMRVLTSEHEIPWSLAFDITKSCLGYTNHTILSEALEQWDANLFYYLLPRQYKVIERLNYDFCADLRKKHNIDESTVRNLSIIENSRVKMANLAIVGSHKVNGVAALHSEIIKKTIFKDFARIYPDKFVNVTNGVTQRRWLLGCNPELASFITSKIGDEWIEDFSKIEKLSRFATDENCQREFLQIKSRSKQKFIEHLNKDMFSPPPLIHMDSLFDVQIKRIHEYKRQLMNAIHIIMLYHEILKNPTHKRIKRTFIFAGKAAAGYESAKSIIRLIHAIARKVNRDPIVSDILKIVYVANYNVSKAEMIIPAADISEQISTAGTEASGTGNMKLAINGALTIGTKDGANIEMEKYITSKWWPFSFGAGSKEIEELQQSGSYQPRKIYEKNEKIKLAIDALKDRTFAQTEDEHLAFCDLYHKLIESHDGGTADKYFILHDLQSYWDAQVKVEELYKDELKWAEFALQNIAGMGYFSTDRSVADYAKLIWGIEPMPTDKDELKKVRYDYESHNRCTI